MIIFQTCTSSRSSLASGSLIGSTLKARMEPSSQVLYSCLCSGTDLVATDKFVGRILQVVLQVNISVSRPGAAHRPSEQPSLPARPTSNGLPVAVAQQPVNKVPTQVVEYDQVVEYIVVRPRNIPRLLRLSLLSPPSPSLYQPNSHMQPSSPNHLRALATLLISTALLLTACLQVISY